MQQSAPAPKRREAAAEHHPPALKSLAETTLSTNFLLSLMIKVVYVNGLENTSQAKDALGLTRMVTAELLQDGVEKDLFEILGRTGRSQLADLRFALSEKGKAWALEALNLSQYAGPAPVTLDEYHEQVTRQRMTNENVSFERLKACFGGLVVPDQFVSHVGPAVNSGRSVLFYGPEGNGKTVIAQSIGRVFEHPVYIPHCLEVDGQIIKIFDTGVHEEMPRVSPKKETRERPHMSLRDDFDARWVRCRRPVVLTGGELTLDMLDLSYSETARFYTAPVQMKATNGVFIVDDFGRQLVSPKEVLNRWIVPLERGLDFMTLQTGKQFPIPFDELVIFSTNLRPKDFMDGAMMRRIHYKMEFLEPSQDEYITIFKEECERHELELPEDILTFLLTEFYDEDRVHRARYHPKWIVEQVVSRCQFDGSKPRLERKLVLDALRHLYTAY